MRGKLGLLLLGLGAFLLVLSPLLRWYAYPRVAVAPIDQDSVTTLVGPDATVFDISSLEEIQTDLTTTARTVGDIEASEEASDELGEDIRVWVTTSSTTDSDGVVRSRSIERLAFDAYTAEAVNCCDEYYETVENQPDPVEHAGLLVKFPFQTEKKTYDWWDTTLREAVPIEYVGTEDVEGYETYKFEHTIEPTVTGTAEVPASVLGEESEGSLTAERVYSNIRTLWVEPNTGVVLKRQEIQDNYLQYDGERRVTTTQVTTAFTDETVSENASEYGGLGRTLNLVHTVLPLVFLVLGLLLLALGLLLIARDRRQGTSPGRH